MNARRFLTLAISAMLLGAVPLAADVNGTLRVDAVELVAGRDALGQDDIASEFRGWRYLFKTAENKDRFDADPERFEVQLGGACGRMGPLSGPGRPEIHAVHDGRIFIFASRQCRDGFLKSPEALIERDDPPPATTPESLRAGAELVRLAVDAVGGAASLDALKTCRANISRKARQGEDEVEVTRTWIVALPDSIRRDETWDTWKGSMVATPDDAFFVERGTARPMHPVQKQALRREWNRHLLAILRARSRPGFVAVAAGDGRSGETPIKLVQVAFDGCTTTLGIDPTSGRVLQISYRGRGANSRLGKIERNFSDFRVVDGLTLPMTVATTFEGEPAPDMSFTLAELQLDRPLGPEQFARPREGRASGEPSK